MRIFWRQCHGDILYEDFLGGSVMRLFWRQFYEDILEADL